MTFKPLISAITRQPGKSGLTALLIAGILAGSTSCFAWWDLGHTALCEQSLTQVKPETRARIKALLAINAPDRDLEPESFGRACTWADRIKPKHKNTAPWHYLNAPPGTLSIDQAAHPKHGDVLTALAAQSKILSDTHAKSTDRAEALRWVGHLVGDLHQPMHLGYESDWGGNKYTLSLSPNIKALLHEEKRDKTNMHAVWDGYLLIYAMGVADQPMTALIGQKTMPPAGATQIPDETMTTWANEGLALLNRPEVRYATDSRLTALDESYLEVNAPRAVGRLQIASIRLAQLLDQLLTH